MEMDPKALRAHLEQVNGALAELGDRLDRMERAGWALADNMARQAAFEQIVIVALADRLSEAENPLLSIDRLRSLVRANLPNKMPDAVDDAIERTLARLENAAIGIQRSR